YTWALLQKQRTDAIKEAIAAYKEAAKLYKAELAKAKPDNRDRIQSYLSSTNERIKDMKAKLASTQ
ncbi:MAG: hypothetical protein ACYTXI_42140, partial [Nostoc sp.]